ncbi:MAG: hypothetical protein ABWK01_06145 [Infirmifilum sp.]
MTSCMKILTGRVRGREAHLSGFLALSKKLDPEQVEELEAGARGSRRSPRRNSKPTFLFT